MRYLILLAGILCLFSGCGKGAEAVSEKDPEPTAAVETELPALVSLHPKARAITETWVDFSELEARMEILFKADGPEQLGVELEELITELQEMETAAVPQKFEQPSVRSRLKLLKTYLLKTQAALHYRTDTSAVLAETAGAYNGLREQLNHIVTSNLDPKLFQDE